MSLLATSVYGISASILSSQLVRVIFHMSILASDTALPLQYKKHYRKFPTSPFQQLETYIQKLPGSNVGRDISYND
jgi:hypothetical protein